jgi:hypothetical protein
MQGYVGQSPSITLSETVILAASMVSGQEKTRLPVRSALFKQRTGGLVVRWVTTSVYPLLCVFVILTVSERNADEDALAKFEQQTMLLFWTFVRAGER